MTAQVDEDPKSFKGELLPYSSSLEYLDDAFQVLGLMLQIAKAHVFKNIYKGNELVSSFAF